MYLICNLLKNFSGKITVKILGGLTNFSPKIAAQVIIFFASNEFEWDTYPSESHLVMHNFFIFCEVKIKKIF